MRVVLDSHEIDLVQAIATQRTAVNRAKQVKNRLVATEDPEKMEREGFGAEVAFCKWANIYPDLTTSRTRQGGHDAVMASGMRVDVKWVSRDTDHLLVALWKREKRDVDAYVVVQGALPVYTVKGWCTYERIVRPECITKFRTEVYALSQDRLQPPEALLTMNAFQQLAFDRRHA